MVEIKDYTVELKSTWCPGCGDFGIMSALKSALVELQLPPEKVMLISGIGCSAKLVHWVRSYGFHSIHGRALPLAFGARMANPELSVVVITGDGDGYGIGAGHFLHALRRNADMLMLAHNNMTYGLTTGQTSPTSPKGYKSPSTPQGSVEEPVNPLAHAVAAGCTFVARGYAGDVKHLKYLIKEGITHKGFALLDVLQPCVTFNKINTYDFFKQRVYRLEESGYKPDDRVEAFRRSLEWGEKIPIGIFYREERPTYEEQTPALAKGPTAGREVVPADITPLMDEFE